MASIYVVTYDTSSGKYLVGLLGSAQLADFAVTSGKIASAAVTTINIEDGAVTSAKIASGFTAPIGAKSITSAHIASGAVGGDEIWLRGVWSGFIASGAVIGDAIALAGVTSGRVAADIIASSQLQSGIIGDWRVLNRGIISGKLASGAVIGDVIAYGGIGSGILASGPIIPPFPYLPYKSITSAYVASGGVGGDEIWNLGVLSGKIASGGVIGDVIAGFGISSGRIASGVITEQNLVSGISIDISEVSQEPSYRAGEIISAYQGIQFSTPGYFGLAKISDIDTMPAIGVAIANIASGAIGTFQYQGRMTNPNWDFSGYVGNLLFLGSGQCESEVTLTAPATSGQCVQRVGKVVDADTIFARPELAFVQLAQ